MSLIVEKHFVVLEYFPQYLKNSCKIVYYWTIYSLPSTLKNQD